MGALAPVAPWTTEDDVLLRNAVEAGASLESLAKGAVQFSRRYTVRELQERWRSLLYDPIVSGDASLSMVDFDRSSSFLSPKVNKFGNPKETKCIGGKRKSGTVRRCYYALRKRMCNEPFNPMDLSFLVGPSDSNYGVEEPVAGNCIPPISDDFGLQSSELEILPCNFAQDMMNNDDAEFHSGCQHTVEKHFPGNLDNGHEGISHIMGENLPLSANESHVEELAPSASFPIHCLFENDMELRPSTFGQLSNDQRAIGSELEDNEAFNSPVSDSGASFHNVEYSSPLPGMPIWRNASAPALPINVGFADKDVPTGDPFELPDDNGNNSIQNAGLPGYDAPSDSELKIEVQHDHLKSPNATAEVYLAELSNSLLNLSHEDELLFMDEDGKDVMDKSYYDGLSSLLLNSPNEVNHDHTANTINEETVSPMDTVVDPATACCGELYEKGSHFGDGHLDCSSEAYPSPCASMNSQCLGKGDEPLFCTLNTEDPEIPSNDDVFLPPLSTATTMGYHFQDCVDPTFSSMKDFTCNEKSSEMIQKLVHRERKNHGQPHASSLSTGLHGLPERGEKHLVGGAAVNLKLSHNNSRHVSSANNTSSINVNSDAILAATLKEENNEISRVNHLGQNFLNTHLEKPGFDSDNVRRYPPSAACGIKQEPDILTTGKDHRLSLEGGTRGVFGVEQDGISSTSDQEEVSIDSEDDVPHFSDIEAMVLDMDLGPEDPDPYSSEEDTKKIIMRLEQGANAYMQRSIASHGALALLYGRYSNHYIKKSEVLLGRATEDVIVDIDLGREGSGNKISRRQAIIKLDQDGFFSLKNLGKSSISVNNKDVFSGHCLRLNSGCLIEIRGMPFIFVSNPARMKQYMDNIGKTSHKQEYQS